MSITFTELTVSGLAGNSGPDYVTGSVAPGANKLILAFFEVHGPGLPTSVTVSGCSLIWVQVAVSGSYTRPSGTIGQLYCFRALGVSPTAGAVTFSTSGGTPSGAAWAIIEVNGVITTGSSGSDAVKQGVANTGSGTAPVVTLSTFENINNGTIFCSASAQGSTSTTPEVGYTGSTQWQVAGPIAQILTFRAQWLAQEDTSPSATTGSAGWAAIGIEAKMLTVSSVVPKKNQLNLDKTMRGFAISTTKDLTL